MCFVFRFFPGAHSFRSYSRHGRGGSNLDAAARTTRMSPPKLKHFSSRSIEWFVKKRKEIPLDYFRNRRQPVKVKH